MGARQAVTRALTSSTHASRYVRSRARLFHVARARLFARPEKSVVRLVLINIMAENYAPREMELEMIIRPQALPMYECIEQRC